LGVTCCYRHVFSYFITALLKAGLALMFTSTGSVAASNIPTEASPPSNAVDTANALQTTQAVLPSLVGHTPEELMALTKTMGQPAFRAKQLHHWLYVKCARDWDSMTDLSQAFKTQLAAQYTIGTLTIAHTQRSSDGTVKYLFSAPDGQKIESVLMYFADRNSYALCISTQVGCAVNCSFCATGKLGFTRQLTVAEITDQYLLAQADSGQEIRNVVFMGQGEPLLNFDNWLNATWLLNQSAEVGMRHMTVSTSGIIPAINQLAEHAMQLTLAVSLHAPTDALREQIMPINRKYPLGQLIPALHRYVELTGRRLTIEYILLRNVNDQPEHAHALVKLLRGLRCNINLIPYNPVDDQFERPHRSSVLAFQAILNDAGKKTTVRVERGTDIDAACGQLANKVLPTPPVEAVLA
jgi:23S rRNA (adenine2503-C2)-methyltransferase